MKKVTKIIFLIGLILAVGLVMACGSRCPEDGICGPQTDSSGVTTYHEACYKLSCVTKKKGILHRCDCPYVNSSGW